MMFRLNRLADSMVAQGLEWFFDSVLSVISTTSLRCLPIRISYLNHDHLNTYVILTQSERGLSLPRF